MCHLGSALAGRRTGRSAFPFGAMLLCLGLAHRRSGQRGLSGPFEPDTFVAKSLSCNRLE